MDEFIQMISMQLGLSTDNGKAATGSVLSMIKDQLDEQTFAQISAKLPEIQGLIGAGKASNGDAGGGGMLGSLTSMAGSLLGGKAKAIADVTSALTKHGLAVEKIPQYLSLLIEFLKGKLGNELFARVAAKLPELLGR